MKVIKIFNQKIAIVFLICIVEEQIYFSYSQNIFNKNNNQIKSRNLFSYGVNAINEINSIIEAPFHAIMPGTKWCGDGSIAKHKSDLGIFWRTDICCRQHDYCQPSIVAGGHLGPLQNDGPFTRSACGCNEIFYHCLKNVSSPVSYKVGIKYFNLISPSCFIYDYPIKRCLKYAGFVNRRCIKYEVDQSLSKTLQWRDNRLFTIF
ncbi:phospholipase A2-like [Microplitis mediator]|uniref:phospholipase A2-like n=1 Tax=Microplitis mediator TaxID=375433 RepID=UPI00255474CB|nr:phospholipase A2-like [Microplitis mediator]XP_057333667.1 phospholipase A2-like [Microplitis mediator]